MPWVLAGMCHRAESGANCPFRCCRFLPGQSEVADRGGTRHASNAAQHRNGVFHIEDVFGDSHFIFPRGLAELRSGEANVLAGQRCSNSSRLMAVESARKRGLQILANTRRQRFRRWFKGGLMGRQFELVIQAQTDAGNDAFEIHGLSLLSAQRDSRSESRARRHESRSPPPECPSHCQRRVIQRASGIARPVVDASGRGARAG